MKNSASFIVQQPESVYRERLENLRNTNSKLECVVLSCGPSLNLFTEDKIRRFCRDKFVISIKLAYTRYPDITDVMMANACNLPYSEFGIYYDTSNVFSIFSSNFPKGALLPKQPCDVFLQVSNPFYSGARREDFVCFNREFDWNNLNKNLYVRCYPGIMGESCFPFIHFMQFKKVYTLGWDLINENVNINNYKHCWDNNTKLSMQANPSALPWDNIANIEASPDLNRWLLTQGVTWNIIGDSCLSSDIPRYKLK